MASNDHPTQLTERTDHYVSMVFSFNKMPRQIEKIMGSEMSAKIPLSLPH